MSKPQLKLCTDKASPYWYVRVVWPKWPQRPRYSLSVPVGEDPAAALAEFEATVLPALEDARQAKIEAAAEKAREAARMSHTRQGKLLRELADWYLQTHLPYMGRAEKTVQNVGRTLNEFIAYCSANHVSRTQQLSGRIVQEWQMSLLKIKGRTAVSRDEILHVRRWLEVCEEAGELPERPPVRWEIPKKRKSDRFRAYSREVIDPWLEGLRTWRPRVYLVAAWVDATGWRIGDALDFRVKEINRAEAVIERTQLKTKTGLAYPFGPRLVELVDAALKGRQDLEPDDHIFTNHKGNPWEYQALVKVLAHYHQSKRYEGPAITFRDLRKSFATRLAMQGCPANVLKELMGHEDVALTLSYYISVDRVRMREWSDLANDSTGRGPAE